jgi:hypothetical protein
MLNYPKKVSNNVDSELHQRPTNIARAEWTPDHQFQAAMIRLQTSYTPHNETDTTTLRRQLQGLLEEIDGSFHKYTTQFVQIYTELIKSEVPNIIGKIELQEWLRGSIKNDQIINHLATTIFHHDVAAQPTFEQIFTHVCGYLTFLGHYQC